MKFFWGGILGLRSVHFTRVEPYARTLYGHMARVWHLSGEVLQTAFWEVIFKKTMLIHLFTTFNVPIILYIYVSWGEATLSARSERASSETFRCAWSIGIRLHCRVPMVIHQCMNLNDVRESLIILIDLWLFLGIFNNSDKIWTNSNKFWWKF